MKKEYVLQDLIHEYCTALPPDVKNKDAFIVFNKKLKDSLTTIIFTVMVLFGLKKEDEFPNKKLKHYYFIIYIIYNI